MLQKTYTHITEHTKLKQPQYKTPNKTVTHTTNEIVYIYQDNVLSDINLS
jgi:hypothetical protein